MFYYNSSGDHLFTCGAIFWPPHCDTGPDYIVSAFDNEDEFMVFIYGSGYRYACGSWNKKTYLYATSDVTVTHDESAVGLVEMK